MIFDETEKFSVAIIGGGFSGTLAAIYLLRARVPGVALVEREESRLARGVAYSTEDEFHLLNVAAGRMSAFADSSDADDFFLWAQSRDRNITSGSFAPRKLYGDYLRNALETEARKAEAEGLKFARILDDVISVESDAEGVSLRLRSVKRIEAARLILALGNFPPPDPQIEDADSAETFYRSRFYTRDPWAKGALEEMDSSRPTLLIGSGLTMIDVALSLAARGYENRVHAVSRHGLLPHAHKNAQAAQASPVALEGADSVTKLLRAIRRAVERTKEAGGDWRAVVDSLRPHTQAIWRRLDSDERRRFLRHARSFWETHRHRMAPEIARRIDELRASGQLQIHAGRIIRYAEHADGVDVTFRRRAKSNGAAGEEILRVGRVINCTGPESDFRRLNDPLVINMRERGLLTPDARGLGVEVSDEFALIGADAAASKNIYALGGLCKGLLWEITAVPDIRAQAAKLARHIAARSDRRATAN